MHVLRAPNHQHSYVTMSTLQPLNLSIPQDSHMCTHTEGWFSRLTSDELATMIKVKPPSFTSTWMLFFLSLHVHWSPSWITCLQTWLLGGPKHLHQSTTIPPYQKYICFWITCDACFKWIWYECIWYLFFGVWIGRRCLHSPTFFLEPSNEKL